MLATASVAAAIAPGVDCPSPQDMALSSLSPAGCGTDSLTVLASATKAALSDATDLTNLGWLQKPGVLTSMCTALTGPQQNGLKAGCVRAPRRHRQLKTSVGKVEQGRSRGPRSSDKMVNVILNVRNRKYNGEDDASKPPLSFACMIFMAVESSPTKTLPVKGIYDWVMWKFPYYRDAPPGWKNSVRHNLSLNKCFKKFSRYLGKSGGAVSKGSLWTVDPDYRRSLLAALKRSPYHPYHSYSSPLSPSSSSSSLDELDPAERDAALTMCMIGGNPDESDPLGPELLHAVYHDHCYTKCPPLPPVCSAMPPPKRVTIKLNTNMEASGRLTIDEIVAAAELILVQDEEEGVELGSDQSSDEGLGGEVDSDLEEEEEEEEEEEPMAEAGAVNEQEWHGLEGSGYGLTSSQYRPSSLARLDLMSSLDEMGANALLSLATGNTSTASTTSVA